MLAIEDIAPSKNC